MRRFTSTQAKQSFGELLEAAALAPVAIEKHRKVKAIVASPEDFSSRSGDAARLAQRHSARLNQAMLEKDRLIKHQRIAVDLLTLPIKDRKQLIRGALAMVERWRGEGLCSQDYIDQWQALLDLPVPQLAQAMTSDALGWGAALRQNSPWPGAVR